MTCKTCCNSVLLIFKTNTIGFLMMIGASVGLILGVGLHQVHLNSRELMYVGFLAELFIQILKAFAIPLLSACFIVSIYNIGKEVSGTTRCKFLVYFIVTKIEATVIGILLALALKPGKGYKRSEVIPKCVSTVKRNHTIEVDELLDMVRNLFPDNWILTSMKRTRTYIKEKSDEDLEFDVKKYEPLNLLGILSVCFFTGISLRMIKLDPKPFLDLLNCISYISLVIMEWILFASPIFLISLVASETLRVNAPYFLAQIGLYCCTYLLGFIFQIIIFYPLIYVIFCRRNPYSLIRQVWEPIKTAFITSSSRKSLPTSITCLKESGQYNHQLVDNIMPIGSIVNKDGCCLMFGIAFTLIAQNSGIIIEPHDYAFIFVVSIAGSIAALGVPHGCLLITTSLLQSAEFHVSSICILFAVDFLIDRIQTVINLMGNVHCVVVLNKKSLPMDTEDVPEAKEEDNAEE